MNRYASFILKEFLHILRDVRSVLILIVMPVVLLLLFGYAVTTEVNNVRVAVLDMSRDELTRKACDRLAANPYVTLTECAADMRRINELLRRGEADVAVVFGSGFAADVVRQGVADVQLLVDGTEPNQATIRQQYVGQVMAAMRSELAAAGTAGPGLAVVPVTRMLYNPQQKSEYNFVPGVIGMILMLVCVELLLASPLSPACIVLSKLVPYFVISAFNVATVLLLSRCVLGVPMAGSLPAFLGVTLLYILVALTLGLLVSNLVRTQLAAMVLSVVFIIPTVYLSGLAFPLESMPRVLQCVSAVVPARWFIDAARRLMIQGVGPGSVMQDVWVMCLMEAVLLAVSLKTFKIRI